jgi:cell filamentation protein, protein adenylyltransferase
MNPRDFILSRSGRVSRTREGYWAFWPDPLPPEIDWTPSLLNLLAGGERRCGALLAARRLIPHLDDYYQLLAAREAGLSCRIDGIQASPLDLLQARFTPDSSAAGTENLQKAVRYYQTLVNALQTPAGTPATLETLSDIHARLVEAETGDEAPPGVIRTAQNWIGPAGSTPKTAIFVPPPADRIPRSLGQLEDFIGDPDAPPTLVRNALAHYQLQAIHPFSTGNGRAGRLLASILPASLEPELLPPLFLSSYLEPRTEAYFALLLAVSQQSAWERWLAFFLEATSAAARDTLTRVVALQQVRDRYQRPSTTLGGRRLNRLVDFLFRQPLFTVRQVESALGVNFATAQRYVDQLESEGIICESTGQKRNRIYRAEEVLKILE